MTRPIAGAGFALMARHAAWYRLHGTPLPEDWFPTTRTSHGLATVEFYRITDRATERFNEVQRQRVWCMTGAWSDEACTVRL